MGLPEDREVALRAQRVSTWTHRWLLHLHITIFAAHCMLPYSCIHDIPLARSQCKKAIATPVMICLRIWSSYLASSIICRQLSEWPRQVVVKYTLLWTSQPRAFEESHMWFPQNLCLQLLDQGRMGSQHLWQILLMSTRLLFPVNHQKRSQSLIDDH